MKNEFYQCGFYRMNDELTRPNGNHIFAALIAT